MSIINRIESHRNEFIDQGVVGYASDEESTPEIEASIEAIGKLGIMLKRGRLEVQSLKQQIVELNEQIDSLAEVAADLQETATRRRVRVEGLSGRVSTLEECLAQAEEDVELYKALFDDARDQWNRCGDACDEASKDARLWKVLYENAREQWNAYADAEVSSVEQVAKLKQKITGYEETVTKQKDQISKLQEEVTYWKGVGVIGAVAAAGVAFASFIALSSRSRN